MVYDTEIYIVIFNSMNELSTTVKSVRSVCALSIFIVLIVFLLQPFTASAQDVCMDKYTAADGFDREDCIAINPTPPAPAGSFCGFIARDMCILQSQESAVCEAACPDELFFDCQKEPCEAAGGGGICEFIGSVGKDDVCVEIGSAAQAELLTPDFWTRVGADAASTEKLDYQLLDTSLFGTDVPDDICSYTSRMFTIAIGVAGILAVLVLVVGGFQYIAGAASPSARSAAKDRITYAVIGLILALASWVILNTINSDLVDGCFSPGSTVVPASEVATVSGPKVSNYLFSINDPRVCVVMRPDVTGSSLKTYLPYKMLHGIQATNKGVDVTCLVQMNFNKDVPINQPGAGSIVYTIGDTGGTRLFKVDTLEECQKDSANWVIWDATAVPVSIPTTPLNFCA